MQFPLASIISRGRRPLYIHWTGDPTVWLKWHNLQFDEEALFSLHYNMHSVLMGLFLAGYEVEKVSFGTRYSIESAVFDFYLSSWLAVYTDHGFTSDESTLYQHLDIDPNVPWEWGDDLVVAFPLKVRTGVESSYISFESLPNVVTGRTQKYLFFSIREYRAVAFLCQGMSDSIKPHVEAMVLLLTTAWKNRVENYYPGLLGMYDSNQWTYPEILDNNATRIQAFRNIGDLITQSIASSNEAFELLIREEINGHVNDPKLPRSAREMLTSDPAELLYGCGLDTATAFSYRQIWKKEAQNSFREISTDKKPPYRGSDFNVFSITELLLDAQEYAVLEFTNVFESMQLFNDAVDIIINNLSLNNRNVDILILFIANWGPLQDILSEDSADVIFAEENSLIFQSWDRLWLEKENLTEYQLKSLAFALIHSATSWPSNRISSAPDSLFLDDYWNVSPEAMLEQLGQSHFQIGRGLVSVEVHLVWLAMLSRFNNQALSEVIPASRTIADSPLKFENQAMILPWLLLELFTRNETLVWQSEAAHLAADIWVWEKAYGIGYGLTDEQYDKMCQMALAGIADYSQAEELRIAIERTISDSPLAFINPLDVSVKNSEKLTQKLNTYPRDSNPYKYRVCLFAMSIHARPDDPDLHEMAMMIKVPAIREMLKNLESDPQIQTIMSSAHNEAVLEVVGSLQMGEAQLGWMADIRTRCMYNVLDKETRRAKQRDELSRLLAVEPDLDQNVIEEEVGFQMIANPTEYIESLLDPTGDLWFEGSKELVTAANQFVFIELDTPADTATIWGTALADQFREFMLATDAIDEYWGSLVELEKTTWINKIAGRLASGESYDVVFSAEKLLTLPPSMTRVENVANWMAYKNLSSRSNRLSFFSLIAAVGGLTKIAIDVSQGDDVRWTDVALWTSQMAVVLEDIESVSSLVAHLRSVSDGNELVKFATVPSHDAMKKIYSGMIDALLYGSNTVPKWAFAKAGAGFVGKLAAPCLDFIAAGFSFKDMVEDYRDDDYLGASIQALAGGLAVVEGLTATIGFGCFLVGTACPPAILLIGAGAAIGGITLVVLDLAIGDPGDYNAVMNDIDNYGLSWQDTYGSTFNYTLIKEDDDWEIVEHTIPWHIASPGIVSEVNVIAGDVVERGYTLMKISGHPINAPVNTEIVQVNSLPGDEVSIFESLITFQVGQAVLVVPFQGEIASSDVSIGQNINKGDELFTYLGANQSKSYNAPVSGVILDMASPNDTKTPGQFLIRIQVGGQTVEN